MELDGLWAWEDEELGLCHDHDDQPSSPGKLQRKSGSAAAIHKTNTINQFHEMLQSSPELTSSLCQVLELSHWGMVRPKLNLPLKPPYSKKLSVIQLILNPNPPSSGTFV